MLMYYNMKDNCVIMIYGLTSKIEEKMVSGLKRAKQQNISILTYYYYHFLFTRLLENDQKKMAKSKLDTSHVLYTQFYDLLKKSNELKKKLVLGIKFKEFQFKSYMAGIR